MDLSAVRGLALTLNLEAHGVPATVTRPAPDHVPVSTTGIWQTVPLAAEQPYGRELQTREPRRVLVLPRSVLSKVPKGTTISAPEQQGGPAVTWRVDELERAEADHWRVIVTRELR